MSWDYAEMSKMAKELGGPEQYAQHLYSSGRMSGLYEGRSQGAAVGIIGMLGGMAIKYLINEAFKRYRERKRKEAEEVSEYKEKLIRAMEAQAVAENNANLHSLYGEDVSE